MNGPTIISTSGSPPPTVNPTPPLQTTTSATPSLPPSRERTLDMDGSSDARLGPGSKFPVRQKSVVDTNVSSESRHDEELSPKSLPKKMPMSIIDERVRGLKRGDNEETGPSILDNADGERSNSVVRVNTTVDRVDGKKGA